jgi:hypothetical protein
MNCDWWWEGWWHFIAPQNMPSIAAEAALSFLKDTKGKVTWSVRDLPDTLKISAVMPNTSSTRLSHHRNFSPN